LVDPTTVAVLAVRSVILRFVGGLAIGAAAAGVVTALVIGSTPVQVGAGVVLAVVLAVAALAAFTGRIGRFQVEGAFWPPEFPTIPSEGPPESRRTTAPPASLPSPAPAAPPRREIPYWLQVTAVVVGIVTGIGGMVIALVK
jgi:hypothetical protein